MADGGLLIVLKVAQYVSDAKGILGYEALWVSFSKFLALTRSPERRYDRLRGLCDPSDIGLDAHDLSKGNVLAVSD